MEDSQADYPADKFEVVEVFRIDARVRIDLKGVIVVSRVFEQTVERIEHFVGEEEKELATDIVSTADKTCFSGREW